MWLKEKSRLGLKDLDADAYQGHSCYNLLKALEFRATAYSSTSAELYWTAANDPKHGRATEYVIYRNGQRLQETSNSSSLWLSGMPRGEVLTFQIVAIYASGARSEKSDAITLRMSAQEQSY